MTESDADAEIMHDKLEMLRRLGELANQLVPRFETFDDKYGHMPRIYALAVALTKASNDPFADDSNSALARASRYLGLFRDQLRTSES